MKSRRRWAGNITCMGDFGWKARSEKKKKPLGSHRYRWQDNIKMDLREIGWGGKDWIHLVEERDQWRTVVNMIVHLHTPQNVC
jgi:hypothetical protein